MARRKDGVCQGSMWRTVDIHGCLSSQPSSQDTKDGQSSTSPTAASSLAQQQQEQEQQTAIGVVVSMYSLLVGVRLICYETLASLESGAHPMASYSLVGASAVSQDNTSFRVVTNQGTHLLCSVPTSSCRDVWLSALNAGLEAKIKAENSSRSSNGNAVEPGSSLSSTQLTKPRPKVRGSIFQKTQRYCHSCGKLERLEYPLSMNQSPLPQYGVEERVDLCLKCDTAQGVVNHCTWVENLFETREHELQSLLEARELLVETLQNDSAEEEEAAAAATDPGDSNDEKVSNETSETNHDEEKDKHSDDQNEDASTSKSNSKDTGSKHGKISSSELERDEKGRLLPISHRLKVQPLSHSLVDQVLQSTEGLTLQRLSPTLKGLCSEFSQGIIGVLEFMELLEHAIGIRDPEMAEMKKQAFRVAGDMGTALKILYEQCLPPKPAQQDGADGSNSSLVESSSSHHMSGYDPHNANNSTELLQCILEFYLDLCEEGTELPTLAFFWPQISNIHLQMLPPTDTASLQRIELLEDFLLTVASKYSIHLAIELVWSHTADLEDSRSLGYCAKRQFAVLRFLCELESLLFDFDGGWGGGSVTVGQFLSPSTHQIDLLKASMERIQMFRLEEQERLSKSQRLHKIKLSKRKGEPIADISPEVQAEEALRVAKNADYLSSHLVFTKRLCDVAEKLRFLPVEDRPSTLQAELSKLNSSGTMGGDPLNIVVPKDTDHTRVVRIPATEGHVFRSKERTPVLLLVETIDEGAEKIAAEQSSSEEKVGNNREGTEQEEDSSIPTKSLASVTISDVSEEDSPNPKDNGGGEEEKDTELTDIAIDSATAAVENKESAGEEEKNDTKDSQNDDQELQPKVSPLTSDNGNENSIVFDHDINGEVEGDDTGAMETPRAKRNLITSLNDVNSARLWESSSHQRLESMQSIQSEASISMAGSQDGLHDLFDGGKRHALRRFDSPKSEPSITTPTARKDVVEAMVTNVVAKQLDLPNLMTLDEDEQNLNTAEVNGGGETDNEVKSMAKDTADTKDNNEIPAMPTPKKAYKVSTLGSMSNTPKGKDDPINPLSKTGDTRREVLNVLMKKGMSGDHVIAEQAVSGAQRHLQDLERRVAVEALLTGDDLTAVKSESTDGRDGKREELLSLGIRSYSSEDLDADMHPSSESDETMEAIRLLLIQYQVATGSISANDGAQALAPHPRRRAKPNGKGTIMHFGREFPEIDAGDMDSRLVGCGVLPPAVLQALTLWKGDMISNGELLELVKKDLEFEKNTNEVEQNTDKLNEDSAFWGRFAFGERWAEKRARIAASSPDANKVGWDLAGIIVKSNDDLRQEAFIMQLIDLCQEAFQEAGLELWLLPYRILSTGRSTGIIEMVRNSMSFDALKKRPGYGQGGLREHLHRMTQYAADPGEAFKTAQRNFVRSLAAYSLLSYLFLFKDRHNGNLLLDTAGHVIHIDFGFVFGVAPGGSFSLEMSTPFKLTEEMIDVMDGLRSSLFSEFVTLFCCGFLALQAHTTTFMTLVEVTCRGSTFKCFEGRDSAEIIGKLQERFAPEKSKEETIALVLDIIKESVGSYGTKQYDYFQYLSQGIAA